MVVAAPGAAGQGEVVGMSQRQWREGEREHLTWGSPQPGHSLQNTRGNNAGCVGDGYFCCTDKSCTGLNGVA